MSSVMEYTLDAETAERGYLLTGETSYLQPAKVAVKKAPGRAARRSSGQAARIRSCAATIPSCSALLEARLRDLVKSVDLYKQGQAPRRSRS